MTSLWRRAPLEGPDRDSKYAITIDSGSSGSRLEIYSWLNNDIAKKAVNATGGAGLPVIRMNGEQKKYHPFKSQC